MRIDGQSANGDMLMGQLSGFQGAPAGLQVYREFYTYQVGVFSNLAAASAAGSIGNNTLQIQADSDFEWTHAVFEYDVAAAQLTWATQILPLMTVQIMDTGSRQTMMNAAVPVINIFGAPENPRPLPITKIFKANSSILFTVQNFDAAVATGNLRLSLLGWKIFYYPINQPLASQAPA